VVWRGTVAPEGCNGATIDRAPKKLRSYARVSQLFIYHGNQMPRSDRVRQRLTGRHLSLQFVWCRGEADYRPKQM